MRVLKQVINGPGDLKRYFPPEVKAEQVFLPDVADLSVGENVCLWFHLPRHNANVYLQGLITWKRARASRALADGSGFQASSGQMSELAFLDRVKNRSVQPMP